MYIVTSRKDNRILLSGKELGYQKNGYPVLVDKETSFPSDMVDIYEIDYIPEEVDYERYCYNSDDGFYINPNWVEITNQYGISDEVYRQIKDSAIQEVQNELNR